MKEIIPRKLVRNDFYFSAEIDLIEVPNGIKN
jgi:hypothetical protein